MGRGNQLVVESDDNILFMLEKEFKKTVFSLFGYSSTNQGFFDLAVEWILVLLIVAMIVGIIVILVRIYRVLNEINQTIEQIPSINDIFQVNGAENGEE